MKLKKLYLDDIYSKQLETLCARENFLINDKDGEKIIGDTLNTIKKRRITDKTRLLIYLTLFEKIDARFSFYDFSFLKDFDLVKQDSHILHGLDKLIDFDKPQKNILDYANKVSLEMLESNKKGLTKWILGHEANDFLYELSVEKIMQYIQISINGIMKGYDYDKTYFNYYDQILDNNASKIDEYELEEVFFNVDSLNKRYSDSIYYSVSQGIPFANGIWSDKNYKVKPIAKISPKLVDDLYYLVRTNLGSWANLVEV